jgi:hypothetical protein
MAVLQFMALRRMHSSSHTVPMEAQRLWLEWRIAGGRAECHMSPSAPHRNRAADVRGEAESRTGLGTGTVPTLVLKG